MMRYISKGAAGIPAAPFYDGQTDEAWLHSLLIVRSAAHILPGPGMPPWEGAALRPDGALRENLTVRFGRTVKRKQIVIRKCGAKGLLLAKGPGASAFLSMRRRKFET